jgi:hypothetical protein
MQLERDADQSPPSRAKVKKERGYTSSPPKRISWRVVGQLYFLCYTASMWNSYHKQMEMDTEICNL